MKILIFGLGEMGKKLIQECITYSSEYEIQAIIDNNVAEKKYCNIPVIRPEEIDKFEYDLIWICTIYFKEIMEQLHYQNNIALEKMSFVEPVVPILQGKMYEKYREQLRCIEEEELEMQEVLRYLKKNPLRMYCYPFYDEYLYMKSEIFFDDKVQLFYGMYENKKMYLSRRFNTEQKARAYFNAVQMEQDSRSPHCYWNDKNMKALSGIGIDIGAAEGVFGLKIMEQIEHLYLIEVEEEWIEALKITYAPYRDKVTIIQKFVGNNDAGNYAKLDTMFFDKKIDFIKLDIEGAEQEALKGAQRLLERNNIQIAVCTYHHKDDNSKIRDFLEKKEYICKNSKGYVVCQGEWELERDEVGFRRALIYANKG